MAKPQYIRTDGGEELVVLTRHDYEALLDAAAEAEEDAADAAMYDQRKADSAGATPLPAAVSRHMLGGGSLLKALRLWRDETQLHLQVKTGLAQGFLSDLETGKRKLTKEVAVKLAKALDIPVDWLI